MRPRPLTATIFGILNIGMGLFGLASPLVTNALTALSGSGNPRLGNTLDSLTKDPTYALWMKVATPLGLTASAALIVAGIGLLLVKNWGRILSMAYAVYGVIAAVASLFLFSKTMEMMRDKLQGLPPVALAIFTALMAAFVLVLSLAYPVALLIFMTRPKLVATFKGEPPEPGPH